jgi:hypothetical protein
LWRLKQRESTQRTELQRGGEEEEEEEEERERERDGWRERMKSVATTKPANKQCTEHSQWERHKHTHSRKSRGEKDTKITTKTSESQKQPKHTHSRKKKGLKRIPK